MKKFIKIVTIMILALLWLQVISNAATATATLTADKNLAKPGNTVTVTLKIKSEDGINGIKVDKITYDTEKLELQEVKIDKAFSNLSGSDTTINAITLTKEKITEVELYTMVFKVKENAIHGATTISTSEIMIDTDLEENSKVTEIAKTVSLDIVPQIQVNEGTGKDEEVPGTDEENPKDTESKEPAPDTGLEDHLFIVIIAVLAIALISYKGYKKFSF